MKQADRSRYRVDAWLLPWVLVLAFALAGCGSGDGTEPASPPPRPASRASEPVERLARVVALGDSLTAGYGLESHQAYPALLEKRLQAAGFPVQVVNAGVSGDTSAGALSRLDWSLDGDVRVLIVALGGNDALRGLGVDQLRANLDAIFQRARARGITVILAGMEAPPNMGPAHTSAFRGVFRDVAAAHQVAFLPFLLQGVAGVAELNQRDGIHPNAAGTEKVADNLWPLVERAVSEGLQR